MTYNNYMEFLTYTRESVSLQFFPEFPRNPSLLFIAGFHGDETECISALSECLERYITDLPSFLYIPYACPSAVQLKRRANQHGRDINRSYYHESEDEEASALMQFLQPYSFRTVYSFHEDPDQQSFYLYDMAIEPEKESFQSLFSAISAAGTPIFTGIDDPDDMSLNVPIENGYIGFKENIGMKIEHGFFNEFTFNTGKSERHITFEIPGNVSQAQKQGIVQQIFNSYILPNK